MSKPGIPKGTRDFGPQQMVRRNYIFSTIKKVFEKYGFMPLETPAMENLSVLMGKYGEEGDKLLYKILNSGDFMSKADASDLGNPARLATQICEKGLRYDLTVPFARFVVMNQHDIAFPFKRYQIQPVWRADRPQKGRYREFYQCDADVVGTDSLICEAENIAMMNEVFEALRLPGFVIKINNRKILTGISEVIGMPGKEAPLCVAIDKIDKIGVEKVCEELRNGGFTESAIDALTPLFEVKGSNEEILSTLDHILRNSETGLKGVEELKEIFEIIDVLGLKNHHTEVDITLARGLSYYTGAIFEVKALGASLTSSISGGGRYDNLTGVFGLKDVSGVGFSFGVDRIYDILEELSLFPDKEEQITKVMVTNFDKDSQIHALKLVAALRNADIASEVYPSCDKMKKQMSYANKKGIPFVLMVGSREIETGEYSLKNMVSGEQHALTIDQIIKFLNT